MNKAITFLSIFTLFQISGYTQILKEKLPEKLVVFTFDDATASQYNVVAPLLKTYGFGATFFICEFPPNFTDSSLYMNWRQIKELNDLGFEIANHTQSHRQITKLSKEEFIQELNYIEQKCDSVNIPVPKTFAYPGYGLNKETMETLKEKGYLISRAGGSRIYNPEKDYPLLIPAWAATPDNETEIINAFKLAKHGEIVVIIFHGVPDLEHPWVTTLPEQFKKYLDFLYQNQYTVISLSALNEYIDVKKAIETLQPDFNVPLKN